MENPYTSLYGNKVSQDAARMVEKRPCFPSLSACQEHGIADVATGPQPNAPAYLPAAETPAGDAPTAHEATAPWHRCQYVPTWPQDMITHAHDQAQSATPARKRRRFDEQPPAAESASAPGRCAGPQLSHHKMQPEDVVLVWDLDETLVLFHSLYDGRLAAADSSQVGGRQPRWVNLNLDCESFGADGSRDIGSRGAAAAWEAVAGCRHGPGGCLSVF